MTVLVTGAAGFIGFHVARALLARGDTVVGVDNLNPYYETSLKEARLAELRGYPRFSFHRLDISDRDGMLALAPALAAATGVIHLAAQAGVRFSLQDPYAYVQANVMGQVVVLELARKLPALAHFVYASSSSVYGDNEKQPFAVGDPVERPNSLYAATKRADELIGHAYAHLYGLPATGLRFFTVYGPWGRPDMAPFLFTRALLAGEEIRVFNHGEMWRDFTYVDDVVQGTLAALDRPSSGDPPHALYNLGNNRPVKLTDFIAAAERATGVKAKLVYEPMQPGDVPVTAADIDLSREQLGFAPTTGLDEGMGRFVDWYRRYYGV